MNREERTIEFQCPHCHKTFTLEELMGHNQEALSKYLNLRVDDLLKTKEAEIRKDEISKQEQIRKATILEEQQKFVKEKQVELDKNQELLNQIKSLEAELDNKVKIKASEIDKQYQEKLALNNMDIQKLKLELKSEQEKAKINLENKEKELNQTNEINNQNQKAKLEQQIADLNNKLEQEKLSFEDKKNLALQKQEAEYNKQINELQQAINANRLIHSKTKGENFEHEVEGELRKAFGFNDSIEKITDRDGEKADYLQIVKDNNNHELGRIVYEVKNAEWKDTWINKLETDAAKKKSKYGILVATSFDEKFHDVPFVKADGKDGIYISDPQSFIFVAQILRKMIEIEAEKENILAKSLNQDTEQIVNECKRKLEALEDFSVSKLPALKKKLDTQLEDISKVSKSLIKHSDTLDKAERNLRSSVFDKINEELGKINKK
ncbi:DUF2130 domain-containing protein [Mesoplasma lactucae]|uniref:Uncharacterized protein n=1 Tax=Mesoplasma lactucae ATCC 49193 TaxID=81460 RepID=A0A291IS08_9MOLU|nr:DUF2130 domain-containing protein [Mesoplasma lactucae]ATG97496.1 hypothetical protein CP520_01880 [Mesoplasma lactucae ATCC 49193]ATZ20048.1 hypothetical protein MLACT_v1c02260 [Mesoplasma lactucae ATCC 49193]MCL8217001.1 hypothetical protein [Mesoplasma lactucae ATCC 49193]